MFQNYCLTPYGIGLTRICDFLSYDEQTDFESHTRFLLERIVV